MTASRILPAYLPRYTITQRKRDDTHRPETRESADRARAGVSRCRTSTHTHAHTQSQSQRTKSAQLNEQKYQRCVEHAPFRVLWFFFNKLLAQISPRRESRPPESKPKPRVCAVCAAERHTDHDVRKTRREKHFLTVCGSHSLNKYYLCQNITRTSPPPRAAGTSGRANLPALSCAAGPPP
jgi:hypothetical protein